MLRPALSAAEQVDVAHQPFSPKSAPPQNRYLVFSTAGDFSRKLLTYYTLHTTFE